MHLRRRDGWTATMWSHRTRTAPRNSFGFRGTGGWITGDAESGIPGTTHVECRGSGTTGDRTLDLKIIRLAKRRMLITSKQNSKSKIKPLTEKPKMKLGVSHRKMK